MPAGGESTATRSVKLANFKEIGFRIVSFVPPYGYTGLNKIDRTTGPDATELARAIETATRMGLAVVLKPHLDPLIYSPGFDAFQSENDSWRVSCPWRGFFDVDPMSDDYRSGVVFASLAAVKKAIDRLGAAPAAPVRLELGTELMNSMVYAPERWVKLLAAAKQERHRLGLDRAVVLSHNFTHHFEIPDDFVARMSPAGKRALRRYIRGLDALALSQYLDLTAAMPAAERGDPPAQRLTKSRRRWSCTRRTSDAKSWSVLCACVPPRSRLCTSANTASAAAASATRTCGPATPRQPRRRSWRSRSRAATRA